MSAHIGKFHARTAPVRHAVVTKRRDVDRAEVVEELRAILVEQLGVDASEVTEASSFQEDLNADSLDLVELIMEMEDRFKLKIPDEDAEKISTVGEAVDYVVAHAS
jgi:acyl carrier protein